jgi:hypothetical protein
VAPFRRSIARLLDQAGMLVEEAAIAKAAALNGTVEGV